VSADKVVRTELITPEPAEALANLLGPTSRAHDVANALSPRGSANGRAGDAEQVSDSAPDGSS